MYSSKEELIELVEIASPKSEKESRSKKRNKVALSPTSTSVKSSKVDIVNLFSVKKSPESHGTKKQTMDGSQTISDEETDEIFTIEKFEASSKSDTSKSYKEKISQHIKHIKEKASNPYSLRKLNASKVKIPLEKLRRQNKDTDADIESVKNKFKKHRKESYVLEGKAFFTDSKHTDTDESKENETEEIREIDENQILDKKNERKEYYSLPEKMCFNIELSEKEYFFVPNSRKNIERYKNDEEVIEGSEENVPRVYPKVCKRHIRLIEQRLSTSEENKWFDNGGALIFLDSPLTGKSIRPDILTPDKDQIIGYKIAGIQEDCTEVIIISENILELYLSHLKFVFHPLFSMEHVFAQKLNDLYEEYTDRLEHNNLAELKRQLDELRHTRSDGRTSDLDNIDKQIKNVCTTYFEEGKRQRECLKTILQTWKQVKKIRNLQKYSNTNVKLLIKKEEVNIDLDNEEYSNQFEKTLQEVLKENEIELESEESDKNHQEIENLDTIKEDLKRKFEESFRAPGEPTLSLVLSQSNEITQEIENGKETMRRNIVSSTKIYLKILCDNIEVCTSKPAVLNDSFSLDINEIFLIQFNTLPKNLSVELIEQPKGLLKKKICELSLTLPAQNVSIKSSQTSKEPFENSDIVHYKHEGIGSGVSFKTVAENFDIVIPAKEDYDFKTTGYLQYSIGWQKVLKETKDDSVETQIEFLNEIVDKNFAINVNKLKEWEDKDEQMDSIEHASSYANDLNSDENKYYRLNPHSRNLDFCNVSEIEQNIRLKILQLRDHHEIEFEGMVIPNRIKEIPYNILTDYNRRKAREETGLFADEEENFENERSFGKKFLKQVHILIFQKCKNSDNNLAYESVVNEKYLMYFQLMIKTLLRNFFNWFRWQPKISKPLPISAKDDSDLGKIQFDKITEKVNIIIKISAARNLPNRTKFTFNDLYDNTENEVRPFVEVSFENFVVRTKSGKGANTVWNETLIIPLESHNIDYLNPSSLSGNIVVNIFDESEEEVKKLSKKCVNWLGGLEVSLAAICHSDTMRGLFNVRLPLHIMGYETELEKQRTKSPKTGNFQTTDHHPQLLMEICVQPNIPKMSLNMEELPSGDLPYIREHVIKWNEAYNESYPLRKFSALAVDTNARSACITRYLKPLEPPQINLEEFDVTPEQCLRYVSLIPFTDCNQFYQNLWLSTDQLLRFMIGSITDHVVALTCYFLALKMDVWLLLGYGIPHGSTAYVLGREFVKNTELPTYYIYDVVYNERYNLTDINCPLQRVYCVANGENVWANTQRSDNINITRFDLTRRSDWLPLFNDNITAPTNFINNKIAYKPRFNTEEIEMHVERKIKRKFAKLRQLDRTVWNHNLGNIFKNALKSLEINCMYGRSHFETITELNDELASYNVIGYAINISFISISVIVKKIKSLGIHIQEEGNIEFALAVYIHVYPGQLLSVWIYIGSVRKR